MLWKKTIYKSNTKVVFPYFGGRQQKFTNIKQDIINFFKILNQYGKIQILGIPGIYYTTHLNNLQVKTNKTL